MPRDDPDLKEHEIYYATVTHQPLLLWLNTEGAAPRVFSRIVEGETLVFERKGVLCVKDRSTLNVWNSSAEKQRPGHSVVFI